MLEQDQWSAETLHEELARLIIKSQKESIIDGETGTERGELAKMFRELACMGYEPLIEAAEELLEDEQDKKLGLHIEVESGLRKVCSGTGLKRGVSSERYPPIEETHLLHQLRELMMDLALNRALKELSEVARLRESLWSGAIMSWLERVEAAGGITSLSRERGLLAECSDHLGHVLEYDPQRFMDEGIDIISELLQRMEHGGDEVSVVMPGESDTESWEALQLSGLLSDLRGVKRLTIDGFGALKELALEDVQGLEELEELDLKVLKADELLSLEGHPLLERIYAGVQHRAERGELTETLKAQLEGASDALWFVAKRCCDAVVSWVKGVRVEYCYCPAGEFWMGSRSDHEVMFDIDMDDDYSADLDDKYSSSLQRVKISKPFLMGKTMITQALWEAVMDEKPSIRFRGEHFFVDFMTWSDMWNFCRALGAIDNNDYRMPTEAEWEYAANAGTDNTYSTGPDSHQIHDVMWTSMENAPAEQGEPNKWGLYDLGVGVWEWCSDSWNFDAYQSKPEVNVDPEANTYSMRNVCRLGNSRGGADESCSVPLHSHVQHNCLLLGGRLLRCNTDD